MRTVEELHNHYIVEKELAAKLRSAGREERKKLYSSLYDELFERVPDHPQLKKKTDPEERRRLVEAQMGFLDRYLLPGATFMEIGCGDCSLSFEAAKRAGKVYGVDVSRSITAGESVPGNFELVISDGIGIDVPPGSVDVAYSYNLIEHLHPDDAVEHIEGVYRILKEGGVFICATPHRFSGPHDISRYFDKSASGFHLHEYTQAEIASILREVGFGRIKSCKRLGRLYMMMPYIPLYIFEKIFEPFPYRLRRMMAKPIFGMIRMIAEK